MTDPLVTLTDAALNCLAVAVSGAPNIPLHICFRVGSEVAYDIGQYTDLCCEGLAYVSLGDTFPSSSSFPEQDIIRQSNTVCAPPSWAQEIRMGIIRCAPVGGINGEPPTCADWNAAFAQNIEDAASLRRAACCLRNWVNAQTDFFLGMSVVINRQIQGNPIGGCVERSQTLMIQFPNCDC